MSQGREQDAAQQLAARFLALWRENLLLRTMEGQGRQVPAPPSAARPDKSDG